MSLNKLNAISPIDGRYRKKVEALADYFSEEALIKYRVLVEIEYFISLCEIPLPQLANFDNSLFDDLRKIYEEFSSEDAIAIKEIEKTTNHDVKAVEYFIKKKFDELKLQDYKEFIHFGLTSQDINNTAIPLSLKEAMNCEARRRRGQRLLASSLPPLLASPPPPVLASSAHPRHRCQPRRPRPTYRHGNLRP